MITEGLVFRFGLIGDCVVVSRATQATPQDGSFIHTANYLLSDIKYWLWGSCGLQTTFTVGCFTPNAIYICAGEDGVCADLVTKEMLDALIAAHKERYDDTSYGRFDLSCHGEPVKIYNGIKSYDDKLQPFLVLDPYTKEWTIYER